MSLVSKSYYFLVSTPLAYSYFLGPSYEKQTYFTYDSYNLDFSNLFDVVQESWFWFSDILVISMRLMPNYRTPIQNLIRRGYITTLSIYLPLTNQQFYTFTIDQLTSSKLLFIIPFWNIRLFLLTKFVRFFTYSCELTRLISSCSICASSDIFILFGFSIVFSYSWDIQNIYNVSSGQAIISITDSRYIGFFTIC